MPEQSSWQNITLFLLTLAALILCALLLQPFFSAIVGAIALAVVAQRPYNWLATKIRNPIACAAVALILVILAIVIPSYFLGQELGIQAFAAVNALRDEPTSKRSSTSSAAIPPSPAGRHHHQLHRPQ